MTGLSGNEVLLRYSQVHHRGGQKNRVPDTAVTIPSSTGQRAGVRHARSSPRWKCLNVRFISTDMQKVKAKVLYEDIYSARGNDELYIKEHKTYMQSDRTSCHRFLANQFRVFLHSAAYVLVHAFRSNMLQGTALATATFETIRLKLLKIGAKVVEMKTRIKVHLPTSYPYKPILHKCLAIFEHLRSVP